VVLALAWQARSLRVSIQVSLELVEDLVIFLWASFKRTLAQLLSAVDQFIEYWIVDTNRFLLLRVICWEN